MHTSFQFFFQSLPFGINRQSHFFLSLCSKPRLQLKCLPSVPAYISYYLRRSISYLNFLTPPRFFEAYTIVSDYFLTLSFLSFISFFLFHFPFRTPPFVISSSFSSNKIPSSPFCSSFNCRFLFSTSKQSPPLFLYPQLVTASFSLPPVSRRLLFSSSSQSPPPYSTQSLSPFFFNNSAQCLFSYLQWLFRLLPFFFIPDSLRLHIRSKIFTTNFISSLFSFSAPPPRPDLNPRLQLHQSIFFFRFCLSALIFFSFFFLY
ncbi:unnamed protein product [Acanthosepion pharaonis]|uniref:Uncharacterized protein n=1 Tax=Acanthosepion pharaonis TaxID=158019 RepID=A0A812ELH5_ACAPH|nr:unnamed protein product [Sepia pharaonis]